MAHICKQQTILETQHNIFETQVNICETQHKIIETQHKIIETQHKIIETQHKIMQNWCAIIQTIILSLVNRWHVMRLTQSCHCVAIVVVIMRDSRSEEVVRYMDVSYKCLDCSEEPEETYKFCSRCGAAVDKEEVLIRYYFQRG